VPSRSSRRAQLARRYLAWGSTWGEATTGGARGGARGDRHTDATYMAAGGRYLDGDHASGESSAVDGSKGALAQQLRPAEAPTGPPQLFVGPTPRPFTLTLTGRRGRRGQSLDVGLVGVE
jgi:hypothetical protein